MNSTASSVMSFRARVVGVVLPPERDVAVLERDEATVRDRDAVRVAGEVLEDLLGAAERRLRVDDPLLATARREVAVERVVVDERGEVALEHELAATACMLEQVDELAAEHAAEHVHREEEPGRTGDPPRPVRRQAAAGDDAVDVRMMIEVLSPRVEDGEEPDVGAEMARIASDLEQRVARGAEQDVVDRRRVLPRDPRHLARQRERRGSTRPAAAVLPGAPSSAPAFAWHFGQVVVGQVVEAIPRRPSAHQVD